MSVVLATYREEGWRGGEVYIDLVKTKPRGGGGGGVQKEVGDQIVSKKGVCDK